MRFNPTTLLLCALLVVHTQANRPFYLSLWNTWKRIYEKTYSSPSENTFRMRIFHNNLNFIWWHNSKYYLGDTTYYVALNAFADLTLKEFANKYLTLQQNPFMNNSQDSQMLHDSPFDPVPRYIDWRKKGLVTPVKDQGQCGSCWAFSATGSLEGQMKTKKGKLISLSEQQLVDCSRKQGNEGCNGGLMNYAFRYWMQSGAESEHDYPYTAEDGSCKFNSSKAIIKVKSFVKVKSRDENQLKLSVAKIGPVSVGIDASSPGFQFYKSGIYKDSACSQDMLDHGVLVVGYDQDKSGDEYWIVKNSWGTSWGIQGYIWMARDNNNMCGIATEASYPVL